MITYFNKENVNNANKIRNSELFMEIKSNLIRKVT